MKFQFAVLAVCLCSSDATTMETSIEDLLSGNHRDLQNTNCEFRLRALVCELPTTGGAAVKYTVNCPIDATMNSDCLIPNSRICYQYNNIPCISSVLCGPQGPIANDCGNIFSEASGDSCSETSCPDGDCIGVAPTLIDYNSAQRNNICMRLGFTNLVNCDTGVCIETNEYWHVLSDGNEIEVEARRLVSEINYNFCEVTYNGNTCSCSTGCPETIPPAISYDCGAFTDDACAAVDCNGNCVNTPGAPVPVPAPMPVPAPEPAPAAPVGSGPAPPGDCTLSIMAYETLEQCTGGLPTPLAMGTILPDGTCRTVAGSDSSSNLLPGNYRAECVANGDVRFLESGCTTTTCDPQNALCMQDTTVASYLYSATDNPVWPVFRGDEDFFDCTTINSSTVSVAFVIIGDCDPNCSSGPSVPTAPAPEPAPAPATVPAPVPVPTPVPVPATVPAPMPTGNPPASTLVDLVVTDPDLELLEGAVTAADLVDFLAGPGPFTLFGPIDSAFLPPANLDPQIDEAYLIQLLTPEFQLHLQNLLAYHVTNGEVLSSALSDGQVVTMLNGEPLEVSITDGTVFLTNPLTSFASVVEPDIIASNGVLHKIGGTILYPSFVGRDLIDLLASDPNFSTLVSLVQMAGLEDALRSGEALTVLAPDNTAFGSLPQDILDSLTEDSAALQAVLLYHVVDGVATSQTLTTGPVPTLNGESVDVVVTDDSITVNGVPVVMPDGLARNGIAHGISAVLIPGGDGTPAPTPTGVVTPAPTPGGTGVLTPAPTPGGTGGITLAPTPGVTGVLTPAPTPGVTGDLTPAPTPSVTGVLTPAPMAGSGQCSGQVLFLQAN